MANVPTTGLEWDERYEALLRRHCRFVTADAVIERDAEFTALGIDSLGILSLVVDCEEAFGVAFPPDQLDEDVLATPGTLWQAIVDLRGGDLSNN